LLYYITIPFCLSLIATISITIFYDKLKNKNKEKYRYLELKIYDLERQLKDQAEKTNLLTDIIVSRTNQTNTKLDNIQSLIRVLDVNILNKNTSQYQTTSQQQPHVSNTSYQQSQANNVVSSHSQIEKESIDDSDSQQNSTVEYILKKLGNKSLTTREIQQIIGRTREHTSRIMKKLYDNKLVDRDTNSKPFRYTITNEGHKQLTKHSVSDNDPHPDYRKNNENSAFESTEIQYPVNSNSE
jgi:DNA-binding MarR family transcriptional regulator/predicted DNA-binding ribbon-helix-helix protein